VFSLGGAVKLTERIASFVQTCSILHDKFLSVYFRVAVSMRPSVPGWEEFATMNKEGRMQS